MATIKIAGRTATIVSAFTLEDIAKVYKYRPEALELKTEEGDAYFKVAPSCESAVSKYGISFSEETFGDGKACVTIAEMADFDSAEEFVITQIGDKIINLNKVEKQIPAALDDIEAEIEAVKAAIEIA